MSNASGRVQMDLTPWGDDKIKRAPADVTKTFYPGMMIALDASGNAVSCDNTSGVQFDGIMVETVNITVTSGAGQTADPAYQIPVGRPWRFTMAIAAAAAGDEGKPLYAAYDNQVAYSTTNSILVGFVDQVLSATLVLVNPLYAPLNPVAVASNTLAFSGTTGSNVITMPNSLADALSVKEGSNAYLTFNTTSTLIALKKNTTLTGTLVITSAGAAAFQVGPNGATNPTLSVVCNVGSEAGGLGITGGIDNAGVALAALGSNTNEPLKLDAKGSSAVKIGTVSTGGALVRLPVATVAAANNAIGNAAAVAEGYTYLTGANNAAAVKLPAGSVGMQVTLQETTFTAAVVVYPQVNSAINNLGANNAYNLALGTERTFVYSSAGQWYCAV